ncbi:MAG: sucrase ferredoxin [Microthrixaceae bacterium]
MTERSAPRFECAPASCARAEPLDATASRVPSWLLIEVHGAWGAAAIEQSALGEHLPPGWRAELKRHGIRPVCIRRPRRPPASDDTSAATVFHVRPRRPGEGRSEVWTATVGGLDAIAGLSAAIVAGLGAPDAGPGPPWTPTTDPIALICTNGRHDPCCANFGRPLVRALAEGPWADRLWECSHIGGDRFAPNMVLLPEGLYFGRLDPRSAVEALHAYAAGTISPTHFRGRSTFRLLEQAAEIAVRRRLADRGQFPGIDDVQVELRGVLDSVAELVVTACRVRHLVRVRCSTEQVSEPLTCKGPGDQRAPRFEVLEIAAR